MSRVVHTAPNEMAAQLVCDLLEAHGIPSRTSGSSLRPLLGALPVGDAVIRVEVLRDEHVEPARALLAAMDDPAAQAPWPCVRCGEENPATFDVCWKCGAAPSPDAKASPSASPYRGEPPPPKAPSAAAPSVDARAAALRDLLWALGAGCLPVALTLVVVGRHGEWLAGTVGLIDVACALEIFLCLRMLGRRGLRLGDLWGSAQSRISDTVAALALSGVLCVVEGAAYGLLREEGAPPVLAMLRGGADQASAAEWALLVPGIALASAASALLFYGVVLPRVRTLVGSRLAAVLVTSLLAALTWNLDRGLALVGSEVAGQIFLCGAFLVVGRVWPLALAAAGSSLVWWILPLLF